MNVRPIIHVGAGTGAGAGAGTGVGSDSSPSVPAGRLNADRSAVRAGKAPGKRRGAGKRGGRQKRSSRLHQALAFLSNIPMRSEKHPLASPSGQSSESDSDGTAQLDAREAPSIRIRGKRFEYVSRSDPTSVYSNLHEARFREALLEAGLLEGRVIRSASKGYPLAVSSVIRYDARKDSAYRARFGYEIEGGDWLWSSHKSQPAWLRWKGKSYADRLHATWGHCSPARDEKDGHPLPPVDYDPTYIDDPGIQPNQSRKQVHFFPGYRMSVLRFVRDKDQKRELNQAFRKKHEWIAPELTLSKIRNLKRNVLELWWRLKLEVATIALAHVCFEKLIYRECVTKANRRLLMAVCVLLAHKFSSTTKPGVDLLGELERALRVSKKQILRAEFNVFAKLDFNLFVQTSEFDPHFRRLLSSLDITPVDYLGPTVAAEYEMCIASHSSMASTFGDSDDSREDDFSGSGSDTGLVFVSLPDRPSDRDPDSAALSRREEAETAGGASRLELRQASAADEVEEVPLATTGSPAAETSTPASSLAGAGAANFLKHEHA